MCGIFAAKLPITAPSKAVFHYALNSLRYRGYDSWGLSYDGLNMKSINPYNGEILDIAGEIRTGILHTRWATNGKVNLENTHPIQVEGYSMVMNGIVTNYKQLASTMDRLNTDTDTEVLLRTVIDDNIQFANGYFAFVLKTPKGDIYGFRRGIPLYAVWKIDGSCIFTSDINAVEGKFHYTLIEENKFIEIMSIPALDFDKEFQNNETMQYQSVSGSITLDELRESRVVIKRLGEREYPDMRPMTLVGSGSSYNAALFASYLSEDGANAYIPDDYPSDNKNKTVFISQSGESFDILDAAKKSYSDSDKVCLVNSRHSSLANIEGMKVMSLDCGIEQAVGATKSFIAQCFILSNVVGWEFVPEITLDEAEADAKIPAILRAGKIFILGSRENYAIAREAALKFKELALVYAEAFQTTEFKHGPLALTDSSSLAIIIGRSRKELIAAEQFITRGGTVLYIDSENPFNAIYEVQYLAIKTALARGINPDFPRNLAKSITVE